MAVFYSFHYDRDHSRVQQIINMGALEGQRILNAQDWEAVKRKGDKAVENWIAEQMLYKPAVVVLVGAQTANRRWVRHEIRKAWDDNRPLVGVRIHGLADFGKHTDAPGGNPFSQVTLPDGRTVGHYVDLHSPSGWNSQEVYANIKANLISWVANACKRS